ncbi:hypothetical protein P5V15_004563 [Pogonomyrmex californicus]
MDVCRKAIRWIYMVDLGLALLMAVLLAILEFDVVPFHRLGFFCNDPKISFKFTGDTISMALLIVFSISLPLVMMYITEYVCHNANNYEKASCRTRGRIWFWYGHYFAGLSTLTFVCELTKLLIGEPRPHFLDTCKPREVANCTDEYISFYTCTNTEFSKWFVNDSSKSFPSGHSALSVYTSIFLVWYLQNRLPNRTMFLKPWLQCLISVWAVICSTTRVSDNRHHWWDVLVGDVLGLLFGVFVVVIPCQHFYFKRIDATVTVKHTLNEPLENGQIISGYNKIQHQQSDKQLSSAIDSEDREMKNVTTWREYTMEEA